MYIGVYNTNIDSHILNRPYSTVQCTPTMFCLLAQFWYILIYIYNFFIFRSWWKCFVYAHVFSHRDRNPHNCALLFETFCTKIAFNFRFRFKASVVGKESWVRALHPAINFSDDANKNNVHLRNSFELQIW